ncbi:MAG: hypothetical protein WAM81_06705 [Acidimicrobiia bacterium]
MLSHPDPAVHEKAAEEWCLWEDAHISLTPAHRPSPRYEDPAFRLRLARLVTHYWRLSRTRSLVRDAPLLNGIPGALIYGVYDVSGALITAWRLTLD